MHDRDFKKYVLMLNSKSCWLKMVQSKLENQMPDYAFHEKFARLCIYGNFDNDIDGNYMGYFFTNWHVLHF